MNKQTIEALKRIQTIEKYLEYKGLLKPVVTEMDGLIMRDLIEQTKLYQGED